MNYNTQNRYDSRPRTTPITKEALPEDYVRAAEGAIIAIKDENKPVISTSKLRSLFSLFTDMFNDITRSDQKTLTAEQVNALRSAKVRIYYEIGREKTDEGPMDSTSVGCFVKYSHLLQYLEDIMDIGTSAEKLTRFYHYMEALVAFHRFYFGEKRDYR